MGGNKIKTNTTTWFYLKSVKKEDPLLYYEVRYFVLIRGHRKRKRGGQRGLNFVDKIMLTDSFTLYSYYR